MCFAANQNDLGSRARRGAGSRRLGSGIKPSRCASFLAALRARRTASAFSRVLRSDGFSYALRRFISKNALALHLLFEGPESLFDIVIANEYPQNVSNRGGPEVSDSIKPGSNIGAVRRSRKGFNSAT